MSKNIQNKIITRSVEVRKTSDELLENRQVEFVISSESVDSHRTVFVQSGGDLSRFAEAGIVCYMHDSYSDNEDNILGSGVAFKEGSEIVGRVSFEPKEINEKAEKIFRKIENGTPFMASIGARVLEAELGDEARGENKDVVYFRKWELLEFSVVPIGSNPDAHKRNSQTVAEIRDSIEKDFTKGGIVPGEGFLLKTSRSVEEAQIIINTNKK